MTNAAQQRRSQAGHALLATMVVVLLLAVAAALVFSVVVSQQKDQLRGRQQLELRAMNDAVIAETLATMKSERRFAGVAEKELSVGLVSSEIEELSRGRFRILARAKIGESTLATELRVATDLSGPTVLSWQRIREQEH